jgi:hypothetical protein
MALAGKYLSIPEESRMIAYPTEGHPNGEYVLNEYDVNQYRQGNYLIDGGQNIGLFWASAIRDTRSLQPKPLEHALQLMQKYNPRFDAMRR